MLLFNVKNEYKMYSDIFAKYLLAKVIIYLIKIYIYF